MKILKRVLIVIMWIFAFPFLLMESLLRVVALPIVYIYIGKGISVELLPIITAEIMTSITEILENK